MIGVLLAAAYGLAPGGEVTTWLATAPQPAPAADEARLGPEVEGTRWTPLLAAGPVTDLGPGKDVVRYLYAEVALAGPLRGWLKTGSDDGLAVWIDGRAVLRVDRRRALLVDEDWTPLDLPAGRHRLLLRVAQADGAWSAQVRLHDTRHRPPAGARVELPGVAAVRPPARAVWTVTPADGALAVAVRLSRDGGAPAEGNPAQPFTISVGDRVLAAGAGANAVEGTVTVAGPGPATVVARWGDETFSRTVEVDPAALHRLAALSRGGAPDVTTEWLRERAGRAVVELATDRGEWLDRLEAGERPAGTLHYRAYRSPYDGRPQPVAIYVPPGAPPPNGWPVIVALHGHGQEPWQIAAPLRAHASTDAVAIVAPYGYGDIVFRGPGEHDVFAALDLLARLAPLDPDRTWLTGLSMGGMATFELGVRHPDRFAALGALCGAGDWRAMRSFRGRRLRPWEAALVDARSPASLAAHAPPLFCVHGTRDTVNPVASSVAAVAAFEKAGVPVRFERPSLGHDVWTSTYGEGRLMPALVPHVRDPRATRVELLVPTTTLVPSRRAWLEVRGVAAVGPVARLHAEASPGRVRVAAGPHVAALRLFLDEAPTGDGPVAIEVDGQTIGEHRGIVDLVRDGTWRLGEAPEGVRRPGLSGPADAVLRAPARVVYGTADPDTAEGLRMLAEHLAAIRPGARLALPVVADTALTARDTTHLILVGSPRENRALAAIADRLPLRVERDAIHVGARAFRGHGLGVQLVFPDPAAPGRLVLVVAGTDLRGALLARHLPDLTPDWLVYDRRVAEQRQGPILDRRRVLGGGFFGPDWAP